MGFRYRKSINLGGGVRLNLSKKGVGISAGVKGFRVSHGADGKTRVTASLPGTGISYQETIGTFNNKQQSKVYSNDKPQPQTLEVANFQTPQSVADQADAYKIMAKYVSYMENGELEEESQFFGKLCTITFTAEEIIFDFFILGSKKVHYPLSFLIIEKYTEQKSHFIFFKKTIVTLKLILDRDRFGKEECIIQIEGKEPESYADRAIEWIHRYKEKHENDQLNDELKHGVVIGHIGKNVQ